MDWEPAALSTGALPCDALAARTIDVPEWTAVVHLAELTADERDQLEEQWSASKRTEDQVTGFRAFVVAFCLCDPQNNRLFPDPAELRRAANSLGRCKAGTVVRLFDICCRLNALLEKDIKELEGNSPAGESGSGDSPSNSNRPAGNGSAEYQVTSTLNL